MEAMKQQQHRQRKLRQVGTPSNPTKFLRDGARYGAIAITDEQGMKRYYLGAQTHWAQRFVGEVHYYSPLFAPTDSTLARRFADTSTKPQID
jgi:hypothetical protein